MKMKNRTPNVGFKVKLLRNELQNLPEKHSRQSKTKFFLYLKIVYRYFHLFKYI